MLSPILALQQAVHHTLAALAAALADLDLTASETNALANLADGRPRSVRELSADTGTRATTLTGVLDRLERRGYLARELDAADRRSFRLTLTPSRLLCVALTDAVGDRRTQNQPGTTDEYPNWRVPLSGPDERPILLEDVLASTRAAALAAVVD